MIGRKKATEEKYKKCDLDTELLSFIPKALWIKFDALGNNTEPLHDSGVAMVTCSVPSAIKIQTIESLCPSEGRDLVMCLLHCRERKLIV